MKKMIVSLTIALVVALAGSAYAVTTTKCYVTVTICRDLAVSLDTAASPLDDYTVDFGACVDVSTTTVPDNPNDRIIVWNASAAGYGDFVLSIDTADTNHPDEWTPSNSVDDETYILYAMFNDNVNASSPLFGDFAGNDILTVTPTACTTNDTYGENTPTSGYDVKFDTSRGLWFRFDSPAATTRSDEATLPVVVSIQAHI